MNVNAKSKIPRSILIRGVSMPLSRQGDEGSVAISRLLKVTPREFSECRVGDESTWDDGGPLSRLGAHDAGRHGDVEGAGDFQSQ